MRYLFLDIDGVLNSDIFIMKLWERKERGEDVSLDPDKLIDPISVEILNDIIRAKDPRIILSSSWKEFLPLEEIQKRLEENDFIGEIQDKTPSIDSFNARRGKEIEAYVKGNLRSNDIYIIIDDYPDMLPDQYDRWIKTDEKEGISEEDAQKAISLLD